MSVREKEIATLLSRPTITAGEKTKLTAEQTEVKNKMDAQDNTIS
jgi:hypothetical protein